MYLKADISLFSSNISTINKLLIPTVYKHHKLRTKNLNYNLMLLDRSSTLCLRKASVKYSFLALSCL